MIITSKIQSNHVKITSVIHSNHVIIRECDNYLSEERLAAWMLQRGAWLPVKNAVSTDTPLIIPTPTLPTYATTPMYTTTQKQNEH